MTGQTTACRVAIIGGGIVGVSTAWHLAERGCTDVVLLERSELTAGSTWHAAGNLPHFSNSQALLRLQQYGKAIYRQLHVESGGAAGLHETGALRITTRAGRMEEFARVADMAQAAGIDMQMVSPSRMKQLHPLMQVGDLLDGLWDPLDGHIDPTSITNLMSRMARDKGVAIRRNTPVTAVHQTDGGRWQLQAGQDRIDADVVVNAAGFRAPEVAAMMGCKLPICSVEHQYLVTDSIREIEQHGAELPMVRDPDVSYYLRQERGGLIIGPYEHCARSWATDGVPPEFGQELLPPDLDRIADIVALAMERVPVALDAGIKTIVNGPITYTPDGLPLVGPVAQLDNCFVNCGSSFGIVQGGGSGLVCAQWILDGQTEWDMWEVDPRRFGDYADKQYVENACIDLYNHEYAVGHPFEFGMRESGLAVKPGPLDQQHAQAGAVFSSVFGWRRPAWFADQPAGAEQQSYRRSNAFASIRRECEVARGAAGLIDLSTFARFVVSGAGATDLIDRIGANGPPASDGAVRLTHALNSTGGVLSEFTVTRLAPDRYALFSAAAARLHDNDVLRACLPEDGSAVVQDITGTQGTLLLTGPNARAVLSQLTSADLSNKAFGWLTARQIDVAGVPVTALRVSFVGELGWELHHPIEQQVQLAAALFDAGRDHELGWVGLRAMDSLRIEKMYRNWRTDLSPEYNLLEAGMERFARLGAGRHYTGAAALAAVSDQGSANRLVCVEIDDDGLAADPFGGEPMMQSGRPVGIVTSGGYAHHSGKSLALAYVAARSVENRASEVSLRLRILGQDRPVKVHTNAIYDPENKRLRI